MSVWRLSRVELMIWVRGVTETKEINAREKTREKNEENTLKMLIAPAALLLPPYCFTPNLGLQKWE